MSESLSPNTWRWVASVVVDNLSDVDRWKRFGPASDRDRAVDTLSMQLAGGGSMPLGRLLLVDLRCVWKALHEWPYVRNNAKKTLPSLKKEVIEHIHGFLLRPEVVAEISSPAAQPTVANTNTAATVTANNNRPTAAGVPGATVPLVAGLPAFAQPVYYRQYAQLTPSFNPSAFPPYNPVAAAAAARAAQSTGTTAPVRSPQLNMNGIVAVVSADGNNSNSFSSRKRKREENGGSTTPSLVAAVLNGTAAAGANNPTTTGSNKSDRNNSNNAAEQFRVMLEQMTAASMARRLEGPNPDTTPQNPTEERLFRELQQMGFDDPGEILSSIRKAVEESPGSTPTSDQIMLDIVHHREEKEEARKMDEARLLSEEQQKRDEQRAREIRESNSEERLLHATLREWKEDMFPDSWLLKHEPVQDLLTDLINNVGTSDKPSADDELTKSRLATKKQFIAFTKYEKKARQWYGIVPKCYYMDVVGERLLATVRPFGVGVKDRYDAITKDLKEMYADIEKGVSLRAYQVEGVPKLFKDAVQVEDTGIIVID